MKVFSGETAPKWGIYQISVSASEVQDPFAEGVFGAEFVKDGVVRRIPGFYDGEGVYRVRFMPEEEGAWNYETFGSAPGAAGKQGGFVCTPPEPDVHGPVRVAEKYHFAYADGQKYFPYGTTCYVWTYQGDERRKQTVETMKDSPFNKMRMCVFPKSFLYNHAEPELFPCEKKADGSFDYGRFNPAFFRDFEEQIEALQQIGVETDIILFHPYDRWGFSSMKREDDIRYLRYFIARTAAFSGIWWSMANEFDVVRAKTDEDWDILGQFVQSEDPYGHLISIHNCMRHYDVTKSWISHGSAQRIDTYRTTEDALDLRAKWEKPIVWDEICYEGNIPSGWGCVDAEELMRRYWEAAIRESYPGHGETFIDYALGEDQLLWWSHGGELVGRSPERIRFLRDIVESAPGYWTYRRESFDLPSAHIGNDYHLYYFGFMVPCGRDIGLPAGHTYRIELIDTWNMTIEDLGEVCGEPFESNHPFWHKDENGVNYARISFAMPGRRYMAARITRVK